MTVITKARRIVFLDLLRALAVIMMIEGHTIDALLLDEYRSYDFLGFKLWQFARGMTAPIFLLTAGTVFIYLLRSTDLPFRENPRVVKGVKRALLLLAFGYLLRFPSTSIIGVFSASDEQLRAFWTIDALQAIGMGILLLLFGAYLSEKLMLNDLSVFMSGAIFFFICAPFCELINWNNWLPAPIAAYFYSGSGSLFPLFPWAGYMLFGGVLGAYLARTGDRFEAFKSSYKLIIAGAALLALYYYANYLKAAGYGSAHFWAYSHDLVLLRLGSVLLLIVLVMLLSAKIRAVPQALLAVGRRTLPIYLLHLVILYGSPWNRGLTQFCDKCLPPWPSLAAGLLMQTAMIGFAMAYSKVGRDRFYAKLTVPQSANRQP
ncbi:MAG: DUF1624 domain-containing protein [Chloracidobacterium sp.]|nr:DUF1624 domain-containing protein [Chloracidobacterium sp.]